MNTQPASISASYGRLTRHENGIIYYYKIDDLITDETVAQAVLDGIEQLDDSGSARVIVIQGQPTSYTYEAQALLFAAKSFIKAALVCGNPIQLTVGQLLQSLAKAHKSAFEVGVFITVEEAEVWISG